MTLPALKALWDFSSCIIISGILYILCLCLLVYLFVLVKPNMFYDLNHIFLFPGRVYGGYCPVL